jgi:hypothetical protein
MTASCGAKMPFICRMVSLRPDSAAAKAPAYVSKASGYTFMLNTTAVSQYDAEETCRSQGAHLASFVSVEDQVSALGQHVDQHACPAAPTAVACCAASGACCRVLTRPPACAWAQVEVESFYITSGYLLPAFHKLYWMGLAATNRTWPSFKWMDRSLAPPSTSTYSHWGKTDGLPEPNSMSNCTAADASSSFGGAWGWNDVPCERRQAFVCRRLSSAGFYYNASNGNTYIFNASYATFDEAEATCKSAGGHLTSYTSYKEQAEVCARLSSCSARPSIPAGVQCRVAEACRRARAGGSLGCGQRLPAARLPPVLLAGPQQQPGRPGVAQLHVGRQHARPHQQQLRALGPLPAAAGAGAQLQLQQAPRAVRRRQRQPGLLQPPGVGLGRRLLPGQAPLHVQDAA